MAKGILILKHCIFYGQLIGLLISSGMANDLLGQKITIQNPREIAGASKEEILKVPGFKSDFLHDDLSSFDQFKAEVNSITKDRNEVRKWGNEEVPTRPEYINNERLPSKKLFLKSTLKYLDRGFRKKMKKAPKNSTLGVVGKVEEASRAKSSVKVSDQVKVKFRLKALQGKMNILIDNDVVPVSSEVRVNGDVNVRVHKNFEDIGLETELYHNVNENISTSKIKKGLSGGFSTELKTEKEWDVEEKAEKVGSLNFSKSF